MTGTTCTTSASASTFKRLHGKRGIAAVEFVLIMPIFIVLLAFPIFFARAIMHYSVAQKAAHDVALFLSRTPISEVGTETFFASHLEVARSIAATELEELNPGQGQSVYVGVTCDDFPCGPAKPKNIRVTVQMRMRDNFFSSHTWTAVGHNGILLTADMRMPYLGK